MNKLSSEYIVDIINQKMAMPPQRVVIRDQGFQIPPDKQLFITVGIVNSFPMAAESYMRPALPADWDVSNQQWDLDGQVYDADEAFTNFDRGGENWDTPNQTFDQLPPTQIEVCEAIVNEWVQIDVCSRNNDSITRNWEVIAALNSLYAKQTQESNNFKISRLPRGPNNTSSAEGGSYLNRYTLTVSCIVWYRKETVLTSGDYYDDFHTRADDEKTINTDSPLIKFEIDQEGIQP